MVKRFRRVATRHDKIASSLLSFVGSIITYRWM
jgi:hypothetical protein